MCGIAGIIDPRGTVQAGPMLAALSARLEHRGPDDQGWLLATAAGIQRGRGQPAAAVAEVLLVQRRLSILDLSEAGWQPMSTPDGRYHIIFNGEIYNYLELRRQLEQAGHRFQSTSDTEVLLHAYAEWGRAALRLLVGMFAFAVLDAHQRRLFLARDFFGIKPLYYTHTGKLFAFASEIKALLEVPGVSRRVHAQRAYEYLLLSRTDHGADTMFAEIKQLPAAHCLEIALDNLQAAIEPQGYWSPRLDETLELSLEAATARLRELFLESVQLHMRSDVPVGAALSGGIDSSAIVAAMRELEPRHDIHTFTYVADDPGLSEERWADLVCQSARTVPHPIHTGPDELTANLHRLVAQQDEPFGSTSIFAQDRVFAEAARAGIKVMLDGQGADELFGGYRPYLAARYASLLRKGHWLEAQRFLMNARKLPGTGGTLRLLLQAGGLLAPARCKEVAKSLAGEGTMPGWLNAPWFRGRGVHSVLGGPLRSANVLREQLYETLTRSSLPMLLRYEDRNSMAHSIESRVPFLTPRLVQFVLQLPEEYIISREGTSKSIFRKAVRGLVPDAILDRRDKIGFATPEKNWLAGRADWVDGILKRAGASGIPLFNTDQLRAEWQRVASGRAAFDFRCWRWVNLILWAEHYQVEFA